ncbi:MAG: non-canonical purine NTP pyrophosphatase, RdgB/HAM1 family [Elusimicrobia bacterium GWA2_61_42]|nr:MAG: non-canonical purine NTP pyrophosphatase, RdgB/HAM1 family [Elusimicrobia bacterium GWA2_61_42]OGR78058.1 MAG: non-canonical purine NTP pyrophosphatase, RdgB/HAM1 family [Elusimicrobia bacterium GWC2_61_25]
MEKTLVIATFNVHKAGEILAILPGLPLRLRTLAEFPGAGPAVEDGETLEENALKKALAAARFTGAWALADDTGLEVDALGGAPGVRSARYAGDGASYADNNAKLLAALAGVPAAGRGARFACVAALASPSGETAVSRGTLEGRITEQARGSGGFGYDPLFELAGASRTLSELSDAEKNALSHRARALAGLLPLLRRLQ